MKVGFLENALNVRGTSIALYDYAHYNETLLGNQSVIITRPLGAVKGVDFVPEVYKKFTKRFPVRFYLGNRPSTEIQAIIDEEKLDVLYVIKGGNTADGLHSFQRVKIIVHAVFLTQEPHGDVFVCLSNWLNLRFGTHVPILPHMIDLDPTTEDFREELNIPKDAVVFGRHGGYETFNLLAVQQAVVEVASRRPDIYFLMVLTRPFSPPELRNIIYLNSIVDMKDKTKYINSCNAMVYGRASGESFGLSIGEFSVKNKPVILLKPSAHYYDDQEHCMILGETGAIWCDSKEDMVQKMLTFDGREALQGQWNGYSRYSPEKVINLFGAYLEMATNTKKAL